MGATNSPAHRTNNDAGTTAGLSRHVCASVWPMSWRISIYFGRAGNGIGLQNVNTLFQNIKVNYRSVTVKVIYGVIKVL